MRNVLFCLVFGLLALSALALPYIATEELVEVDDQPVEVVRTARSPHYGFGRRYGGYGGGYGGYHRPRPYYGGYGGYGRPYGGYGGGFGGSASYANAGSSSFGGGFGGGSSSFANAGSVSGGFYG